MTVAELIVLLNDNFNLSDRVMLEVWDPEVSYFGIVMSAHSGGNGQVILSTYGPTKKAPTPLHIAEAAFTASKPGEEPA